MRRVTKVRIKQLTSLALIAMIAMSGVLFQGQNDSTGWNGWWFELCNWGHNLMGTKGKKALGGGGGGGF